MPAATEKRWDRRGCATPCGPGRRHRGDAAPTRTPSVLVCSLPHGSRRRGRRRSRRPRALSRDCPARRPVRYRGATIRPSAAVPCARAEAGGLSGAQPSAQRGAFSPAAAVAEADLGTGSRIHRLGRRRWIDAPRAESRRDRPPHCSGPLHHRSSLLPTHRRARTRPPPGTMALGCRNAAAPESTAHKARRKRMR